MMEEYHSIIQVFTINVVFYAIGQSLMRLNEQIIQKKLEQIMHNKLVKEVLESYIMKKIDTCICNIRIDTYICFATLVEFDFIVWQFLSVLKLLTQASSSRAFLQQSR